MNILEVVWNCKTKKNCSFLLILPQKHGVNQASRWIRVLWSKGVLLVLAYFRRFWVLRFFMKFSIKKKKWVFGYSWSTLPLYWCYYPHRSRDALSPVCGIFLTFFFFLIFFIAALFYFFLVYLVFLVGGDGLRLCWLFVVYLGS